MRGGFITFEGIDGSGKTTQADILVKRLAALGLDVVRTYEPGDTPVGQAIRSLCLDGGDSLVWETEMLLMAADRAQHVSQVIQPALERGAFVVCDRYVDSSLAYQGYGAQRPVESVAMVNSVAMQGIRPDLTLLLAVPPEQRLQRPGKADCIERRDMAYHRRVYEGFLRLSEVIPRMVRLDIAGLTEEEVASLVWKACLNKFPFLQ